MVNLSKNWLIVVAIFTLLAPCIDCGNSTLKEECEFLVTSEETWFIQYQNSQWKSKCEIDEDILVDLSNQLCEVLRIATMDNSICEMSSRAKSYLVSGVCEEYMEYMKELTQKITREIKCLVEYILSEPNGAEVWVLIAKLEAENERLAKEIDDLDKVWGARYEELMKRLSETTQKLQEAINEKTETIRRLSENVMEKSFQLVVTNIQTGKLDRAYQAYLDLGPEAQIPRIVSESFDPNRLVEIIRFSSLLKQSIRWSYLKSLYSTMGDYLRTGNIILLKDTLENEAKIVCGTTPIPSCTLPEDLKGLYNVVDRRLNEYIQFCASSIQSGTFGTISNFASPADKDAWQGKLFGGHLQKILDAAYLASPTDAHLRQVFDFIASLKWNAHVKSAITHMFDLLKMDKNRILIVAIRFKKILDTISQPYPPGSDNVNLPLQKNMFPQLVKNIVWHTKCYLLNSDKREYIYANGDQRFSKVSRRVYTHVPGTKVDGAVWAFEPVEKSRGSAAFQFKVRNYYWDEYLVQANNCDGERGYVATCIGNCVSSYIWDVELYDLSKQYIRLKYASNDAYLYASNTIHKTGCICFLGICLRCNKDKRVSYIWLPGGGERNIWQLSCE